MGISGRPHRLHAVHQTGCAPGAGGWRFGSGSACLDLVIVWHGGSDRLRPALRELLGAKPGPPPQGEASRPAVSLRDVEITAAHDWILIHRGDVEIVAPQWLEEWVEDDRLHEGEAPAGGGAT